MYLDNLSASVLRLIEEQDLTYESASERCDLSVRHFGSIVRGKTALSVPTLEKLCIGFDTTPNMLLLPCNSIEEEYRVPMLVLEDPHHQRTSRPICPHCRLPLGREYQRYCDYCGQCLDWRLYRYRR